MSRPLAIPPLGLLLLLAACNGDDTVSSESDAGSESASASSTTTDGTAGTMTEGMSASTTAGSDGESEGSSTTASETTTSASTSDGTTTSTTSDGSSTTDEPILCEPSPAAEGSVAVDPECEGTEVAEVVDPWNFSVEWQYELPGNGAIVMPAVGNLTDDNMDGVIDVEDVPDIVVNGWSANALIALHGDGSGKIFEVANSRGNTGPAIADVDSDGEPEIVSINTSNQVIAVSATGQIEWTSPAINGLSTYPQVTVADLDEDGDVEVIADIAILDGATGAMIATMVASGPWRTPVVADLDLDGSKEIILHTGVFASDGANLWGINGSGQASFAAVANIDEDPEAEVLVNFGSQLHVHEHDGALIGTYPIPGNTNLSGPPCMADFDGDGDVEIAVPAGAKFDMLETDGTLIWQQSINDSSGAAGCAGYDVNGDGTYEVMFADQDALRIYDGPTGAVVYQNDAHSSGTVWEYPVVADVDKDGSGEIIVVSNGNQKAVTVFGHNGDGWAAAGPAWPIHDFAVTNIGPDCSVPQSPTPSWADLNVFRARPVVDDPALPDLVVEVNDLCVACDELEVYVSYQVCNQGAVDVEAGTPISIFSLVDGVEVLVQSTTLPAIPAGACPAGDFFVFNPDQIVDGQVVVRIYDDGNGTEPEAECNLTNDQVTADVQVCGEIPG
ncbi:MAG: VCBS repeat-containing protein [Nannocystaceae bacterium]